MAKTWGFEIAPVARRWELMRGKATAAVLLLGSLASAQPDDAAKNAARELAEQGAQAMARGDFAAAQDLYQRAYALVPAPTLSIRRARALEQQGRWVEALEAYVRTTRTHVDSTSPPAFREAVEQAHAELAALRPKVPKLKVIVVGATRTSKDLRLLLDGKPYSNALVGVESPVDPGGHEMTAETADGRHAKTSFEATATSSVTVELALPPAPERAEPETAEPPPPAPTTQKAAQHDRSVSTETHGAQRTWALVCLGAGAAGLGVGVVTGLMATSKHNTAEDQCPGGNCVDGSAGAEAVDSFRSLRAVSTVGYVVGVVGVGAGVTLWLTAPKREAAPRMGAWFGPAQAGVRGTF